MVDDDKRAEFRDPNHKGAMVLRVMEALFGESVWTSDVGNFVTMERKARDAIAAMRDATPQMVDAAYEHTTQGGDPCVGDGDENWAQTIFRAMIDGAVK